jgi:hypothetical protein
MRRPLPVVSWAVAWAALLSGCLIPQEDHILGDLPPRKNQPPQILENLLVPANRFVTVQNGSNCKNLLFQATVSDPDVQDRLIYNFYIDSNLNPGFVKQAILPNGGLPERPDPAEFEVSFAVAGPLQQPGEHVVEVLVADGPLVNRDPQPRVVTLLDGGTALDPSYAVTYAWVVTVNPGPCPP